MSRFEFLAKAKVKFSFSEKATKISTIGLMVWTVKGTFYSESAVEMSNRHIKVPKIVPGPKFPVSDMNCSNKMIILTFFSVNKINVTKARTNMF